MYDLHTHSYNSDGVLGPAELARRCMVQGCLGLVISDHCDSSNLIETTTRTVEFCRAARGHFGRMQILPGCELTHVPPTMIAGLADAARNAGAVVVLVHGETITEPVAGGTNLAAIEAGADVLAHPGLITPVEAALAAERGIRLEITARAGHCLTNGHVARLGLEHGCRLSFGSDGHAPGDYPDPDAAARMLRGAGLTEKQAEDVMKNNASVFEGS